MTTQPTGTVTLLFTDIEGSTRLLHRLGRQSYAESLALHRDLLREAFDRLGGYEVNCEGDSFFVAFEDANAAVAAAAEAQEALARAEWPAGEGLLVRMGIHTGEPAAEPPKYVGLDVHLAARIMAAGHGGQVLLSEATHGLADVSAADLGEHRLKDFDEPVRLFQLGGRRFPPLLTIANTNLVRPPTSFVGREEELADLLELLRSETRLVTLTGPGGTGKTRLALEAAFESIESYPNGVWFVPLSSVTDQAFIEPTIAHTVGARGDLHEHLRTRRLLLVLDNLEHLQDPAHIVAALVGGCPDVRVLATSREHLNLSIEQEYPVHPLRPDAAAELFVQRARQRVPGFEPNGSVLEIARHLDGLPLAVELAAARVKVLTPAQMLERLGQTLDVGGGPSDLPARQRTLHATIDWSYHLLDDAEQTLFARLAVFRGGCTLESAEGVVDADLDTMQSLVDKSLVRQTDERFWMLATIREYAAERLDVSGDREQFRRRHADHFLALAEEAEPNLRWSGSPGAWLDRLDREHDNLRAALDHLSAAGESQSELQLAGALYRFWAMRGHLAEGARRIERALAADERPTAARARALNGAAVLTSGYDDATARRHAEQALALQRALGDSWGIAFSSLIVGEIAGEEGDLETAHELCEEALREFRALGDNHHVLLATQGLAGVYEDLGDLERARTLHEDTLRTARAVSNRRLIARSLGQLAPHARDEGQIESALAMLKESLRILVELDDRLGIADDFGRIARTLAVAGRGETAIQLVSAAEALYEETGQSVPAWHATRNEETLTIVRSQLDDAALVAAREQGRALALDEAVALAIGS